MITSVQKWVNARIKESIFGNEINGISQSIIDLCDLSLEIPQWGTKHSMNISVVTGIVLWTIKLKKLWKT